MVEPITPVIMANRTIRPYEGRNDPASERKNQITTRGMVNEKRACPMPIPLRYRSTRSFATSGDCCRFANLLTRGVKRSPCTFVVPVSSALKSRIESAHIAASIAHKAKSRPHENPE
ncbi:MAG: hypothetical protein A4E36_00150 [Methanoregulaceae archaeon PtaB.Bin009]|nr:MAG: hypothetical protein A4E36_00150 [Methanoregulaceae archaeon PtaB.Bin009]